MINLDTLLIESERLWLRPIEMKDAQNIFDTFTATVTKYMFPRPNANLLEVDAFISQCMMRRRQYKDNVMTIILQSTFEFIGIVGVHNIHTSTPELGVWIKEDAFGHGYGREAVHAIVDNFNEIKVFDYYIYPVDSRNTSSQNIAKSLGGEIMSHRQEVNQMGKTLEIDEYWIYVE